MDLAPTLLVVAVVHGLVDVIKHQFPQLTGGTLTNLWALVFGTLAVVALPSELYVLADHPEVANWFDGMVTVFAFAFGGGLVAKGLDSLATAKSS